MPRRLTDGLVPVGEVLPGLKLPQGTVKLSGILGFWRRNRSSVERRINNLGTYQGAD